MKRFPFLWVILYRESPTEDYRVHSEYPTRKRARNECESLLYDEPKWQAYVQKYGPYR
jgi:hypothetical protein